MRIFTDHCVYTDIVESLRHAGFTVERAIQANLHQSSDEDIFNYALKTSQVLLTFDQDFTNIFRFDIRKSAGVVVFHIKKGISKETIIERVVNFFSGVKSKDLVGTLFIVDFAGRIRSWPGRRTRFR